VNGYAVVRDDNGQTDQVEGWPWTKDGQGAITATSRAAQLSILTGTPHEVHRPDGRLLARFVAGRRADLDPSLTVQVAKVAGHM
jgi:hypothetical protein